MPVTGIDPRSRRASPIPAKQRGRAQVARLYGPRPPARGCRTCRSATSSSAAAPTAASRICAPPPTCCGRARSTSVIRQALVVPGSGLVKRQAEAEGLDRIFIEAGFEWREPGCSMCLAMNPDKVPPGERCASTSNRNFVGRQGPGARTHLLSPAMAAAAAVNGPPGRRARAGRMSRRHRGRGPRLSAGPRQYRHRHHHSRRASQDGRARGPGPLRFRDDPRRAGQCLRRSRLCGRVDPDRRRQFRLRLQPRACGLGDARPRHPGGDRAGLFRHFREQCLQERAGGGRAAASRRWTG